MKTVLLTLLTLLVFSFSGCVQSQIVYKTEYVKRPMPVLPKKPVANKYNMFMVDFNGEEYYALRKSDAGILESNWVSYKNWCETNNEILTKLKD